MDKNWGHPSEYESVMGIFTDIQRFCTHHGGSIMGTVTDIQRFCTHDGPGIRTTVFLKGCPLRCPWCHNPETNRFEPEVRYLSARCVGCGACMAVCPAGCHRLDEKGHRFNSSEDSRCQRCLACVKACPTGALSTFGQRKTADEILDVVERDRPFYREKGGLTLSGGEPFAQPAFALSLLRRAKEHGLNTCAETCGAFSPALWDELPALCDTLLFDLKDTDAGRHQQVTGAPLAPILDNLRRLDGSGIPYEVRCIVVRGVNDEDGHARRLRALRATLKHCRRLRLFPCHPLGGAKLQQLGRPGAEALRALTPDGETLDRLRRLAGADV
ncbi:MAG: glycyl-radical enzyme activating protein [Clostridiales bacterium]|nr:glycyl-radical enzyme activating protein [Clostridiales bacterium]